MLNAPAATKPSLLSLLRKAKGPEDADLGPAMLRLACLAAAVHQEAAGSDDSDEDRADGPARRHVVPAAAGRPERTEVLR